MSRLTASQEDYIKIIYELSLQEGGAHISDIAAKFGVSKASASVAVKSLQKKGLVWRDAGRLACLTQEGRRRAVTVLDRYSIIRDFLTGTLHIDPETAHADACALEHSVSEKTANALCDFMNRQPCRDAFMLQAE